MALLSCIGRPLASQPENMFLMEPQALAGKNSYENERRLKPAATE
jgi:hypothetical protein